MCATIENEFHVASWAAVLTVVAWMFVPTK
jgi:hypothetical protein